ncbi:serine endopeptidase [Colletotrichum truncatum]|uniref:Serine endopeptidase n=1 Tax=Colletotrichum truncatum TaxID=5467 RepID=A0ACC3Z772_COLTU|nr:serine endopeptidase [Colletotrichum truncatum]KAF6785298.1 serine endopeptidase [Colletotrichum truncatum]
MRVSHILHALPLACGVLAIRRRDDADSIVATKQFIIEVEKGTDVDALSAKLSSNRGAKIVKTFKSDVFTGLTIESETDNIDSLQLDAGISKAWTANQIWLSPYEPVAQFDSDIAALNYSQHKHTGVDKAHEAGIFGKGARVAVIDTGADYNHPALGGGFGPGFKAAGGWDFVGDEGWPSLGAVKKPDNDPMDSKHHGTHVAGIIAGKSEWFTGVAPEAELYLYKVFSQLGSTDDATLIDALIRAYEEGADVITASIGGAGGFSGGPWATVASRIAEQGVVVTISAANSGVEGPIYGSSGAAGKEVLAIASGEAGTWPGMPFELTFNLGDQSNTTLSGYLSNYNPWTIKDWSILPLSFDTSDPAQACKDVPENTPDLSDKIVLVRRGGCDLLEKESALMPYNATYVMFYNNEEATQDPLSWLSKPKSLVDAKVGEAIIETIKAGGNVTADFSKFTDPDYYVGMHNSVGLYPNQFTSWGGLYNLELKPDVAAPGGRILSPVPGNRWAVLSGTSMSCPYVAGIAALYIGKYGGRKVHGRGFGKMLNRRIISSGASMPWSIADSNKPLDTGFWAPTIQVGSGIVNAWKVLSYKTGLTFDKFALNDTEHFNKVQTVEIANNADVEVEYHFALQPAAGIEAKTPSTPFLNVLADLKPLKMVPSVELPSGTFKLKPGEARKAEFIFDYPQGLDQTRQPLFSGKILISSSLGEELAVPYFGAAFSLNEQYDTLLEPGTVSMHSGTPSLDVDQKPNVTFDLGRYVHDYFRVYATFRYGCSELRWDIFEPGFEESQWKYPPVVGKDGYVGSATNFIYADSLGYYSEDIHTPDDVVPFPIHVVTRNTKTSFPRHTYIWLGKLANDSNIAPGQYQMRFAALKPFGVPQEANDWDVFKTPVITVLPKPTA